MGRYQISYDHTLCYYNKIKDNDELMCDIMKLMAFGSNGKELKSIMLDFQVHASLAVLTHLTKHRIQELLISDFKNIDLLQYKVLNSTKRKLKNEYAKRET